MLNIDQAQRLETSLELRQKLLVVQQTNSARKWCAVRCLCPVFVVKLQSTTDRAPGNHVFCEGAPPLSLNTSGDQTDDRVGCFSGHLVGPLTEHTSIGRVDEGDSSVRLVSSPGRCEAIEVGEGVVESGTSCRFCGRVRARIKVDWPHLAHSVENVRRREEGV